MADFTDDIPEARRETLSASAEPSLAKSPFKLTPWLVLIVAALGLGGASAWWLRPIKSDTPKAVEPQIDPAGAAIASETAAISAATPDPSEPLPPDSLLGHRPYEIADANNLATLSTNSMIRLKPEVAQKIETMMVEAKSVGVKLDVISGFRSLEDQEYLFFELKAERGQSAQIRAEVSAPPGYSEHHTGYAVDFIDGSQPATDLEVSFENTPAFRWLKENAAYYGFEMSFPKDDNQDVAYEPWHWRYVGNQESLELFYRDRN